MLEIHPLSVTDFGIEINTNSIGTTMQILYMGKPSSGMSEFSGTRKNAQASIVAFLRRLADDIAAIDVTLSESTSD